MEDASARGLRHYFGLPGGGFPLDLLEAGRQRGVELVSVAHESSAAIMAGYYGHFKKTAGIAISIKGVGAGNLVGGALNAFLERMPLVCLCEGCAHRDRGFRFGPDVRSERVVSSGGEVPGQSHRMRRGGYPQPCRDHCDRRPAPAPPISVQAEHSDISRFRNGYFPVLNLGKPNPAPDKPAQWKAHRTTLLPVSCFDLPTASSGRKSSRNHEGMPGCQTRITFSCHAYH